jgi:hypothetical protein
MSVLHTVLVDCAAVSSSEHSVIDWTVLPFRTFAELGFAPTGTFQIGEGDSTPVANQYRNVLGSETDPVTETGLRHTSDRCSSL